MFRKSAIEILENSLVAINNSATTGSNKLWATLKTLLSHPFKLIAAFLLAPFLCISIALSTENIFRKIFAVVGLLTALGLSYITSIYLGKAVGAFLIASNFGFVLGFAFFFGTAISVILSVLFSIFVFNATSYLFLKMNTEEVIEYLKEQAK